MFNGYNGASWGLSVKIRQLRTKSCSDKQSGVTGRRLIIQIKTHFWSAPTFMSHSQYTIWSFLSPLIKPGLKVITLQPPTGDGVDVQKIVNYFDSGMLQNALESSVHFDDRQTYHSK